MSQDVKAAPQSYAPRPEKRKTQEPDIAFNPLTCPPGACMDCG